MAKQKVVLITGANSGIGNETVKRAVKAGYTTYGGARRTDTFPAVQSAGGIPVQLDVTDEASMRAAVAQIEAQHGVVDVLVNNAGFGQMGPIETITPEQWQYQYQVNVFGLVRMAQLVIPGMRRQGSGRIINISSMGGEFTFPLGGAYHSTKYAVESINEAMRFELKPFGIAVITIQPSPVTTPMASAASESIHVTDDSPYKRIVDGFTRMSQNTSTYIHPERVAEIILKAMQAERPRPRYRVGMMAYVMPLLHRLLSDRHWDALVGRFYS